MAEQPDALSLDLKLQHVIALRKAIACAVLGEDCRSNLTAFDIANLSQVERQLWPAWKEQRAVPPVSGND